MFGFVCFEEVAGYSGYADDFVVEVIEYFDGLVCYFYFGAFEGFLGDVGVFELCGVCCDLGYGVLCHSFGNYLVIEGWCEVCFELE